MLHHPQVKEWARREAQLFQITPPSMPVHPGSDATPKQAEAYRRALATFKAINASHFEEREHHNLKWRNIQRHLQHRQNVTLLV